MIVDHAWRPTHASGTQPVAVRFQCSYLGTCGRLRDEHEQAVTAARLLRTTKVRQS